MRRLHGYLGRTVVGGSLAALTVILALILLFDFIDELRDVGEDGYGIDHALVYVLLILPQRAYDAFPVATLIGALMGLGGLAARHELVAMRAAGVSAAQIARAVLAAGLWLSLAALALGEWAAPRAGDWARQVRSSALAEGVASGGGGSFWARDGARFLHVRRASEPRRLEGVRVFLREPDGRLARITEAPVAHYRDGRWELVRPVVTRFTESGVRVDRPQQAAWDTSLRPDVLEVVVREPESLPISELFTYSRYLERNGLPAAQYRLAFWVKLAMPFATLAMLLLTVPLAFGQVRRAGAGQQLFLGVLIGIGFFLLNRFLNRAGLVYGLPPVISAFGPTVLVAAVALVAIRRTR